MNAYFRSAAVGLGFSEHGDALLYGQSQQGHELDGLTLKRLLFAWHEPSFYGTSLEIQDAGRMELVVLPAELVVPFLASRPWLSHVQWSWKGLAAPLVKLAPRLAEQIEEARYKPSLSAYRRGRLEWTWDERFWADDESAQEALGQIGEDADVLLGLRAAFSAAVYARHYGTEAAAADLRREHPLLFDRSGAAAAGMDEEAWLVAVGWKADVAPFRPAVQLLEPEEDRPEWRLNLVLQDKWDASRLAPLRLDGYGDPHGDWPDAWEPFVRERAAGWAERLRALLPGASAGRTGDVLGRPLTSEAAWRFLTADSRRLLEAGWVVLLPAWWETASRRKPRLRAKVRPEEGESRGGGESRFGLNALVEFDWRVSIGEADLSEAEFAELVARGERLVRFRDQWVPLDPALLAQIQRAMQGIDRRRGMSFQDVLQLHLLRGGGAFRAGENQEEAALEEEDDGRLQLEVELNAHLLELIGKLGSQAEWPVPPVPAGLQAQLRPYQQEGFGWLAFLRRFGLGACLADDMGLGKTVQLISYLLHVQDETAEAPGPGEAPALIICPTSVLGNWQKELARFGPSLRVRLHYGPRRASGNAFTAALAEADVILTSYATASLDQELLQSFTWNAICLDEAQNIKNANTRQSVAVRSFPARHRIALTGTPIENRLAELWSIYDFITPGYLGSQRAFQDRFAGPIEKEGDERRTAELRKLVKPFMLRRKKKDPAIQLDLPDKNEMKTYVPLTAEQAALYDQTVNGLLDSMKDLEGMRRKGAILSALTKLKQLCDHPALLTQEPQPVEESLQPAETAVKPAAQLGTVTAGEASGPGAAAEPSRAAGTAGGLAGGMEGPAAEAPIAAERTVSRAPEAPLAAERTADSTPDYAADKTASPVPEAPYATSGTADPAPEAPYAANGTADSKPETPHAANRSASPTPEAPYTAASTAALVARSSKLERLLAMVKELRAAGERCLIFTQYIGMGEMLKSILEEELEEPVFYLHGGTSKTARDRMVDTFQSPDGDAPGRPGVFILSLKAGGVGLNLTAANHVFHFDRWWNPAVENQATDRAYRMGQTRDVQVHKFISLGTLEERIDEMLESKQQLSDNVISSSEGWITELSDDSLRELFTLRREWVG
ncbi:SNF2-related protein [Paenibacillus sp. CN-4]|uniref:SNF2-related protein n=1 Tax=Paenibacillus nanchangensis TaxID=3348343 RepID=UPI003979BC75